MIIHKDFLNKIKDFGLNSYEAKLWTALISKGIASASELSEIADVPRSRSYDVLESLEKKGFIIMKLGKPIKYISINPSEIINRVKKNISEEFDKQVENIESLKNSNILSELVNLHDKGFNFVEHSELTGLVKSSKNICAHLEHLLKNASTEIILVLNSNNNNNVVKNNVLNFSGKNIIVKIITNNVKEFKLNKNIMNCKIKEIKNINTNFCIIDGRSLFIFNSNEVQNKAVNYLGLWVNADFFVKGFCSLFDILWYVAK